MGSRTNRGLISRRDIRDASKAVGFVALLGTIIVVTWIARSQPQQEFNGPRQAEWVEPDATPTVPAFQPVSQQPAPHNPVELAEYDVSSAAADEKDAHDAFQTMRQQTAHKQSELRVAVQARDGIIRQIEAARLRAAAKAQQLFAERALLAPLQAADDQARSRVFDAVTELKQADVAVMQFNAEVTALSESNRTLAARRDALQAELDYEVAMLPTQLASMRQDLRLKGNSHLLSQSVERARQREERDRVRELYGPICQLYSRQSEAQRESLHASVAEKNVVAVIDARLRRLKADGLARQAALRRELTDIRKRLVLKEQELGRRQQYLDEAWKAYGDKQSELQYARRAQARTAAALRAAQEQVASRSSEVLATQQETALLQPALAAAEEEVRAASADVDGWVAKLASAQEKLKKARAATRDARTMLFTQKAAAESSAGIRATMNVSF